MITVKCCSDRTKRKIVSNLLINNQIEVKDNIVII